MVGEFPPLFALDVLELRMPVTPLGRVKTGASVDCVVAVLSTVPV